MSSASRTPLAAGLDAAAVTMFVAIGRRTHHGESAIADVFETGAPFLIALAVGWLVAVRVRRDAFARDSAAAFDLRFGAIVWAITLVLGMVLRRVMFGDGTAASFVIVAAAFLLATLLGWRLIAQLAVRARRTGRPTEPEVRAPADSAGNI